MKKSVKTVAICALVVGAFCFGKSLGTNPPEFPELNQAKNKLMGAKTNLQNAAKDFGGHRAKAVDYVDKAIKEVDEAVLYGDKK